MTMRCDKAYEILADINVRFVQFRQVILAMEGKADTNGWTVEISLCARLAPRVNGCCSMQDTTTFSRGLHSITACSCPRDCPQNRARRRRRLRFVKPTGTGSHGGATAPPSTDGGRPALRISRFASPAKGDNLRLGQQCRGDHQYNHRLPTFCRPRREMHVRARDSSR